ncbi:MAG: hypothetical protein IT567_04535 [Alphaproteobacteria bacterium]|nr:hypothetical protein [Alphaproteobacteria bacterium]
MAGVDENTITAAMLAEAYGLLTRSEEGGRPRSPAPTQAWYGADKHVMSVLYEAETRAGILVLAEDLRKTPREILDRILLNNTSSLEMALAPRELSEFLQRICPNDRDAQWELLETLSRQRSSTVGDIIGRHKDNTLALLREASDGRGLLPMLEELLGCPRIFQASAIMQDAVELRELLVSVGGDKQAMFRIFTDRNITDMSEINAVARNTKAVERLIRGIGKDGATVLGALFASDSTYAPDADAARMRAVLGNVDGVLALINAVGGDRFYALQELIESSPATGKIFENKDRRRTLLVAEHADTVVKMLGDSPLPPAEVFQSLMRLSWKDVAATITEGNLSRVYARIAQQRLGNIGGEPEAVERVLRGASAEQQLAIIDHAEDVRGLITSVGGNGAEVLGRMLGASGYAQGFNDELTAVLSRNARALSQLMEQSGFPQEFFPCLFEMSHPRLVQTAQKADMEFLRGIRAGHAREELKTMLAGTPIPDATPPRHPEDKPFILQIQQAKGGLGNSQPRYEIALATRPGLIEGFGDEDRHRMLNEVEKLMYQALKLPVVPGTQEGTYEYPREGEALTDSRKAAPLLKRISGAEETLKVHVNPATTALLQELLVSANRAPEIPAAARGR